MGEVEERHHYQDEPAAREQGTYPSHKPGNLDHKFMATLVTNMATLVTNMATYTWLVYMETEPMF